MVIRAYSLLCSLLLAVLIVSAPRVSYCQVTLNGLADMDFGNVDFAATYSGSVQLGTNGTVQTTGFGISSTDNGNAGQVRVTFPDTGIVELKCAQTAQMISPPATALNITNMEVAVNTGVAFSNGTACQGTAGADPVTLTLNMAILGDPDIFIGGEISIPGPISISGLQNYSSSGGTPIRLSFVVQ